MRGLKSLAWLIRLVLYSNGGMSLGYLLKYVSNVHRCLWAIVLTWSQIFRWSVYYFYKIRTPTYQLIHITIRCQNSRIFLFESLMCKYAKYLTNIRLSYCVLTWMFVFAYLTNNFHTFLPKLPCRQTPIRQVPPCYWAMRKYEWPCVAPPLGSVWSRAMLTINTVLKKRNFFMYEMSV